MLTFKNWLATLYILGKKITFSSTPSGFGELFSQLWNTISCMSVLNMQINKTERLKYPGSSRGISGDADCISKILGDKIRTTGGTIFHPENMYITAKINAIHK